MSKQNIVLLYGENTFNLHEKIRFWKQAFIEKYNGDINIDEFDGQTEPHLIVEAASAMPFLSEKRLVVVKNFLELQKPETLKKMADHLDLISENTVLIFIESTPPDKRTTLFKKIQKIARIEEFKPLSSELLLTWTLKKILLFIFLMLWAIPPPSGILITK
ncbi:MAG: hypothetical protein UT55_C0023G0012 [Candidatus Peregrinibacteria bacterium GW2011_GWE2_39_6]|nr:MAG: hypothetical protein UT55_C0023G0012 [Candidatus Peregrinibacteria bacterium GW2011_GWE2_39_6]